MSEPIFVNGVLMRAIQGHLEPLDVDDLRNLARNAVQQICIDLDLPGDDLGSLLETDETLSDLEMLLEDLERIASEAREAYDYVEALRDTYDEAVGNDGSALASLEETEETPINDGRC